MFGAVWGIVDVDAADHQEADEGEATEESGDGEHGPGTEMGADVAHQNRCEHAAERLEAKVAAEAPAEFLAMAEGERDGGDPGCGDEALIGNGVDQEAGRDLCGDGGDGADAEGDADRRGQPAISHSLRGTR